MKYRAATFAGALLITIATAGFALWWKTTVMQKLDDQKNEKPFAYSAEQLTAMAMNNTLVNAENQLVGALKTNADMIDSVNDLAFQMARQYAPEVSGGNLAISPISLAQVLWVMGAGAGGATSAEMASRLRLRESWDNLLSGNRDWLHWLSQLEGIKVEVANALWHDRTISIKSEFASRMTSSAVEFKPLNDNLTSAAAEINAWASDHTHGKISRIIDRLDPQTSVVLTNAVYFKGDWKIPFEKEATTDSIFLSVGGNSEPCRMMRQSGSFQYGETTGVQWLRMPYKPYGEFSMVLALPAEGNSVTEFISALSPNDYAAARGVAAFAPGTVELPKFRLESNLDLISLFDRMGLAALLSDGDFSAMSDQMKESFLLDAVQRVIVEVDEKGTEAAAVTAIGMPGFAVPRPPPPFHFRADRPFVFFIEDSCGMILFAGVVNSVAEK